MEFKDLKSLNEGELTAKIQSWKEELFRAKFKGQTGETRDTSVFRKLRKHIARAYTVINQAQSPKASEAQK